MASPIAAEGAPPVARGDPDRLELAGMLAAAARIRAAAELLMVEGLGGGAPRRGCEAACRLAEKYGRKLAGADGRVPDAPCGAALVAPEVIRPAPSVHEPILGMSGRHLSELYEVRRLGEGADGH